MQGEREPGYVFKMSSSVTRQVWLEREWKLGEPFRGRGAPNKKDHSHRSDDPRSPSFALSDLLRICRPHGLQRCKL